MRYRFGLRITDENAHHASAECDIPNGGGTIAAEPLNFFEGSVMLTNGEFIARVGDSVPYRVTLFDLENNPVSHREGIVVIPPVEIVTLEEIPELNPPPNPPEGGG